MATLTQRVTQLEALVATLQAEIVALKAPPVVAEIKAAVRPRGTWQRTPAQEAARAAAMASGRTSIVER